MITSPWFKCDFDRACWYSYEFYEICHDGLCKIFDLNQTFPKIQFKFFDCPGNDRVSIRREDSCYILLQGVSSITLFSNVITWMDRNLEGFENGSILYVELWTSEGRVNVVR
jgi:hypothetical protein